MKVLNRIQWARFIKDFEVFFPRTSRLTEREKNFDSSSKCLLKRAQLRCFSAKHTISTKTLPRYNEESRGAMLMENKHRRQERYLLLVLALWSVSTSAGINKITYLEFPFDTSGV